MDDLKNPTPVQVQLIFEMFADVLMGVRKDTVEPILRAAVQDNLDYPEMQTDAHTVMSFYYSLRQLMAECGVEDFSYSDLNKPEYERLKRILSYLINFTRFREGKTDIIDEVYQKSENDKEKIEQYYYENTELHNRIQTLRALRVKEEPLIKQAKDLRCELVADLEKLRKKQEALIIDLDNLKQARAVMSKSLVSLRKFLAYPDLHFSKLDSNVCGRRTANTSRSKRSKRVIKSGPILSTHRKSFNR